MKARLLCLLALAPGMLDAQIVLYSLSGIAPSPLGTVYGYGQVAAGDSMIVRFRALNTGTAPVTITCLSVKNTTGAGFAIVNSSSTPFVVAAGQPMDSPPSPSPAMPQRSRWGAAPLPMRAAERSRARSCWRLWCRLRF